MEPKEELIPIEVPVTRTPPNADAESRVNTVRMIVLRGGYVRTNQMISLSSITTSAVIEDYVPVGLVDFFLIANERSGWNLGALNIGDPQTKEQLKSKILNFTAHPAIPQTVLPSPAESDLIPMARIYEALQINSDGTAQSGSTVLTDPELHWGLQRLYAKLTFNLEVVFADLAGHDPIKLDSIAVRHLPSQSYLGEKPFTLSTFFDPDTLDRNQAPNVYGPSNSLGFDAKFITYLPEHLVANKDDYTYISLNVNLAGSSAVATKREYKIVIGESIRPAAGKDNDSLLNTSGPTNYVSDYYIRRNTHYQFDAILKSYDHSSDQDLILKPRVMDWDESFAPDTFDYDAQILLVNPSDIIIPAGVTTYQGVIDVYTDYQKGWNATVSHYSGTGSCAIIGGSDNRPNGQLKFNMNGGSSGNYAIITITTGKDRKMERKIKVTKL
ncbi:MAG: hypothetical protein LBD21_02220 [Tannerellaceae bacterium]|nr:hypothetical protein [Tannerellaceae bacterium]